MNTSAAPAAPTVPGAPVAHTVPWCWSEDGWCSAARHVPSPNHGDRPAGLAIDLVVVHSISLPPGEFGGDAIERLFTNTLDADAHPAFAELRGLAVSAHFLVRRQGELLQFVGVERRAWHAGRSSWRGRTGCNDYSVGIELEGLEGGLFEPAQYRCLATLIEQLGQRWPITEVTGHEHVAPGRKGDPGAAFDWPALTRALRHTAVAVLPRVLDQA
jgi:AmpD protein